MGRWKPALAGYWCLCRGGKTLINSDTGYLDRLQAMQVSTQPRAPSFYNTPQRLDLRMPFWQAD